MRNIQSGAFTVTLKAKWEAREPHPQPLALNRS